MPTKWDYNKLQIEGATFHTGFCGRGWYIPWRFISGEPRKEIYLGMRADIAVENYYQYEMGEIEIPENCIGDYIEYKV